MKNRAPHIDCLMSLATAMVWAVLHRLPMSGLLTEASRIAGMRFEHEEFLEVTYTLGDTEDAE